MRRMGLLGNGMIGSGDSSRHIGPPYYLVNDTFTTDRATGAVNGTNAEPGPGRRVVVDGNSKLSLSGGQAIFATGGVSTGDPGLWYGAVSRVPGRLLVASVTPTTNNKTVDIGFDSNQAGQLEHYGLLFRATGALTVRISATPSVTLQTYTGGVTYTLAVVLRTVGGMILRKSSGNWLLDWVTNFQSTNPNPIYLNVSVLDAGATVDYARVPAALWLPTPLVSDGFSSWGSSDGLGHAEGIVGGLGSGGNGLAYTTVGTWGASGGVAAASALSGGFAIAYRSVSTADIIATVKVTRSGGDAGLILRYTDSNNHITCHHNGTNVVLLKKAAGVATTVQSTATTYVAGAELRVIAQGTKFRVYYNNALVGSEQTISDAEIQSATNVGLYTTNTGNSFDDLVVYARGSGGEYAALDAF